MPPPVGTVIVKQPARKRCLCKRMVQDVGPQPVDRGRIRLRTRVGHGFLQTRPQLGQRREARALPLAVKALRRNEIGVHETREQHADQEGGRKSRV